MVKKTINIFRPFYGLLPFKLGGRWYWFKKIKRTSLLMNSGELCPIKNEIYDKNNMKKVTLITFENFKNYVGKQIEVEIACYSGGIMYPDDNRLLGMNKGTFYFVSEEGTDNEYYWHHTAISDKECAIQVWDYEEYKKFYEDKTKNILNN